MAAPAAPVVEGGGGGGWDFLKLPDFLDPVVNAFGDVWANGPAALQHYVDIARDTWKYYTESQSQRFEHLAGDVQARFMNSGMDGAVVFFFLTLISRRVLNKFVEPYILRRAFCRGRTKTSVQTAKWLSTSWILLVVWLRFSNILVGVLGDNRIYLDIGLPTVSTVAIASLFYGLTGSLTATAVYFVIPLLVLMPVALTVTLLHSSPFIPEPWAFPYVIAGLTTASAIYFILEAPPTVIMHKDCNGQIVAKPFSVALRDEMHDLWTENWWTSLCKAPGSVARKVARAPHSCGRALRKSGRRFSEFRDRGEESGREAANTNPVGRVFANVFYFILGMICHITSFVYRMFVGIINFFVWILSKFPFAGQWVRPLSGPVGCNRYQQRRPSSSRSRSGDDQSSRSSRSGCPKLSNRVSRRRGDEDQ